ncbi:helix-turn-helix domain-containing protein [Castellaniella sp.]|uniref:helix-turn-helix domain-containing protein n=1 Tax=Castellaniella sp. TaxID=1955812 RepID=UPI003C775090
MDALIAASARALAAGDPLAALQRIALRDDPPALALRGIAMAQLGEYARSRELLLRARRSFGHHETLARARCVVAEAEVALAARDLGGSPRALADAAAALDGRGDHTNAMHARITAVRKLVLLGRLQSAEAALARIDILALPAPLAAMAELLAAELALRALRVDAGKAALARARTVADRSRIPALLGEVDQALAVFEQPAARLLDRGDERVVRLEDVAALFASGGLVVDACRHRVGAGADWRPLARRPVLFALARSLARAWPGDVDRDALIAEVFRMRHPDESHRVRLRVEMSRLRAVMKGLAGVEATACGFALRPANGGPVAVLAPPGDDGQTALLALLADGAAWSTSALALALDASQRTVQRDLAALHMAGRVRSVGRARTQRWLSPPLAGFTTILLLPAALPIG